MREIKFRAWDKACNTMIEPDDLRIYMNGTVSVNQVWATNDLILLQYTGLHDCKGVGIYESDIVRILYTDWPSNPAPNNEGLEEYKKSISLIGEVVYCNTFGRAEYEIAIEDDRGSISPGRHGEIEVIGNIHQRPDLLNKE